MKRITLLAVFVPVLSLLTFGAGCTKKDVDTDEDRPVKKVSSSRDKGGPTSTAATREPLKATATDGVITGRVVLKGDKPVVTEITKMATHNDAAVCLKGSESEKTEQQWRVGKDNGVENVVVFLKAPAGKYFPIKIEGDVKKMVDKPAELDQPHCAFLPHV